MMGSISKILKEGVVRCSAACPIRRSLLSISAEASWSGQRTNPTSDDGFAGVPRERHNLIAESVVIIDRKNTRQNKVLVEFSCGFIKFR
jgi:hypothetical protein